jgi:hypothetical protein
MFQWVVVLIQLNYAICPPFLRRKKRLKKNLTKKQPQQQDKIFNSTEMAPPMDGSLL